MISRLAQLYGLEYVERTAAGKEVLRDVLSKAYSSSYPSKNELEYGKTMSDTWKDFDSDCQYLFGKADKSGKLSCEIDSAHKGNQDVLWDKCSGKMTIEPTAEGGFVVSEYDNYTTQDKYATTTPFKDHKVKESTTYSKEGLAETRALKTWASEPTAIAGRMMKESIEGLIGECTTVERAGGVFARVTTDPFYLNSRSAKATTVTTTLNSEYGYNRLYTTGRDDTTYAEVSAEVPNADTLYHFGKAVAAGLDATSPELRGIIESQIPNRIKEAAGLEKSMGD